MKKSSNTYIIILFVLVTLLAPFVMNRAEAQTTYRVYARSDNYYSQMYFYTYDHGLANGEWGEANKITNTEVINGETWYYFDYDSGDYLIIFRNGNGNRNPADGQGGIPFGTLFSTSNRDDASSKKTATRLVTYAILGNDNTIRYTTEAAIKSKKKYRAYVMFVGSTKIHPYMYAWIDDQHNLKSWPGIPMVQADDKPDWWLAATDEPYKFAIFNNYYDDNNYQTNNISVSFADGETDKYYIVYTDEPSENKWWNYASLNNSSEGEADNELYFVSPELTGDEDLPAYKLVPNRHRLGGPVSKRYYTFNFKNDHLKDYSNNNELTEIHWYIHNRKTGECYRPRSNDDADIYLTGWGTGKNGKTNTGHAVCPRVAAGNNERKFYQKIQKKGADDRMSFTVFLDTGGEVWMNENSKMEDEDDGFVLIGNFSSAMADVDIRPDLETGRKAYTKKLYWENGISSSTKTESPDSIVYYFTVERPPEGWGQLYLGIAPASTEFPLYGTDVERANNKKKWEDAWKTVIRPQIHDAESFYQTDARALAGGLIENLNGDGQWLQSLNPEVSNIYTSYEFSMNVTYSTYRLIFKTELALVGTAVTAENGETYGGSFNINNDNQRINLEYNETEGCYKWPYNDGIIHIKSYEGKDMPEFRFVVIGSSSTGYKWNLSEDENAPTSPYYNDADHGDRPYIGGDTQFKNALAMHKDGPEDATHDPGDGKNLRSYLPDGDYVLRFYIKGDETKTYYYTLTRTLKMRDFESKGSVKGLGDYTYFTTWSDYLAYEKPAGVDIYAVIGFDDGEAEVRNITNEVHCLPAKTGLILAKNSAVGDNVTPEESDEEMPGFNVLNLTLKVYDEPEQSYAGESLMNCAYQAQDLPQYTDDGTANYLFGAYRKDLATGNTSDTGYLLGFWLSNGTNRTYHNSAYLSLSGQQLDDIFQGNAWNNLSLSRSWINLSFGEYGSTTSIATPRRSDDSDLWYNLQGVGMAQPKGKGIYIHQGKKVAVR